MCGRFSLVEALEDLQTHYHFLMRDDFHYDRNDNITPSQEVMAVVNVNEKRYPVNFRWGLIPPFAKDSKVGFKTFNARSETVHEKPSFRKAFKSKRCIIPASAFYEWQKKTTKDKQPFRIESTSQPFISFAGLWETWRNGDGVIKSCTILTTEPNEKMAKIHDRMPVILSPENYDTWLSPASHTESLKELLMPFDKEKLNLEPISNDFFKRSL